jgi:hypothetical protein
VRPPVHLDVCALPWAIDSAAALVCIAPWSATKALFCGGRSLLSGSGLLCLLWTLPEAGPARATNQATLHPISKNALAYAA